MISRRNDGDCIEVTAGEICDNGHVRLRRLVHQRLRAAAGYEDAVSGITTETCPCFAGGSPRCVAGSCAICPDPSDPNQPPACQDRDAGEGDD